MVVRVEGNLRVVEGFGDSIVNVRGVEFRGESALVNVCVYDTIILFDVQDPTDPADDIVFDDSTVSALGQWEMREVGGRWLRYTSDLFEQSFEVNICAS